MDLRDLERRAVRGDKAAALRVYYARMSGDAAPPPAAPGGAIEANVPKLGKVKVRPVSGDFLIVEGVPEHPGREGHFALFGVPLRLGQVRYSYYPAHPELGWTTLNDEGVRRLEEHGPEYVSDYFYDKNVWLYRADAFHEDASGAAKKKVRQFLDPAVNALVEGLGGALRSAELDAIRDREERLFKDIRKKREELEELESQAADLAIQELRAESRGGES